MLTDNSISATSRGKLITVAAADIVRLHASDKYVEVTYHDDSAATGYRVLLVSEALKLIINTFPNLVSVSRSEAIAKARMGKLSRNLFDRSWQVEVEDMGVAKVSRRFVPVLREVYGIQVAR